MKCELLENGKLLVCKAEAEVERLRADVANGRRRELALGNEAAKQALTNAELLAAAKVTLASLEHLGMDAFGDAPFLIRGLRAALAKAEGRTEPERPKSGPNLSTGTRSVTD